MIRSKKLLDKLEQIKQNYEKIQEIIDLFPSLEDEIISKNINTVEFGLEICYPKECKDCRSEDECLKIYIKRRRYSEDEIFKFKNEKKSIYLFEIKVNPLYYFKFKFNNKIESLIEYCYYYDNDFADRLFYIEDKELEFFLGKLKEWFDKTEERYRKYQKELEIQRLEKRLKKLKNE